MALHLASMSWPSLREYTTAILILLDPSLAPESGNVMTVP